LEISGTGIPLNGDLYAMLANVYDKSGEECTTPIRFVGGVDGTQTNEVRSALIELMDEPTLDRATKLAERLGGVTTGRSGLGLLFVVIGMEGGEHKLLVARFPANEGVLAELGTQGLSVEFVKRVFMKNSMSYKAALYRSTNPAAEFWEGTVADKQLKDAADYWIKGFLKSDLRTTSREGSRRLAMAFRDAAKAATSVEDKHQLVSAIALVSGLKGHVISPREIFERFGLAETLQKAVIAHLPNDASVEASFVLDAREFHAVAGQRTVKMSTGGILTAATDDFDKVFEREAIEGETALVKFTTVGIVVDETVKGA
jgi:hypothetical protein